MKRIFLIIGIISFTCPLFAAQIDKEAIIKKVAEAYNQPQFSGEMTMTQTDSSGATYSKFRIKGTAFRMEIFQSPDLSTPASEIQVSDGITYWGWREIDGTPTVTKIDITGIPEEIRDAYTHPEFVFVGIKQNKSIEDLTNADVTERERNGRKYYVFTKNAELQIKELFYMQYVQDENFLKKMDLWVDENTYLVNSYEIYSETNVPILVVNYKNLNFKPFDNSLLQYQPPAGVKVTDATDTMRKMYEQMSAYKKKLQDMNPAIRHYKSGWLTYLGNPTGKQDWEIEAAGKAVIEFQKAVNAEPDNKIFRVSLAYAFEKTKNTAAAEKEYQKTIRLDPKDAFLHFALGKLYAQDVNTKDKTIRKFETAIQLDPDEALFHYHLAYIFYQSAGPFKSECTVGGCKREYATTDEKSAEKAFAEIKIGNTRTKYTEYQPPFPTDFTSKLDYMRVISLAMAENLPEFTMIRDLSRRNISFAKRYEERYEDKKALDVYQAQLILGKRFTGQKPMSQMKMLVGSAMDQIGYTALEKFYSSRNMKEGVEWAQKGNNALKEILDLSRKQTLEIVKHTMPFWSDEENKIRQADKEDFYFLESSFVRDMLARWPDVTVAVY